jgi:hypothetical protein
MIVTVIRLRRTVRVIAGWWRNRRIASRTGAAGTGVSPITEAFKRQNHAGIYDDGEGSVAGRQP